MYKDLKKKVFEANLALVKAGLVKMTWGNASGFDRGKGVMVIKPSGVSYALMQETDMVVLDLDGNLVEGDNKPSSDTATHLELYRAFPSIGGIVHTHSTWATSWAQACREIPCLGTTHADHFFGPVPCTRSLHPEEIKGQYEKETGKVIIETMAMLTPDEVPGILVAEHGPFTWGRDVGVAVQHAVILEEVAKMAFHTILLGKDIPIQHELLEKHYLRKHGKRAYYGQGREMMNDE